MKKFLTAATLLLASSVVSLPASASVWHGKDADSYETTSKEGKGKKTQTHFDTDFEYSTGTNFSGGSESSTGGSSYKNTAGGSSNGKSSASKSSGNLNLDVLIALLELIKNNPDLQIEDIIAALKAYLNGGSVYHHHHYHGGHHGGKGEGHYGHGDGSSTPVPLPAPILLFASALLGLFGFQKINRKA